MSAGHSLDTPGIPGTAETPPGKPETRPVPRPPALWRPAASRRSWPSGLRRPASMGNPVGLGPGRAPPGPRRGRPRGGFFGLTLPGPGSLAPARFWSHAPRTRPPRLRSRAASVRLPRPPPLPRPPLPALPAHTPSGLSLALALAGVGVRLVLILCSPPPCPPPVAPAAGRAPGGAADQAAGGQWCGVPIAEP